MDELYSTNPNSPDSHDTLPMLRDLFSKHPDYRHHEPWELTHVLFSLGYTDEILDEAGLASAAEIARCDSNPDEGAA